MFVIEVSPPMKYSRLALKAFSVCIYLSSNVSIVTDEAQVNSIYFTL